MTKLKTQTVLIVGAGPTGLVLAICLAQLGIKIRIIDENETSGTTSRAMIIHARTLELYRKLGLADTCIKQGIILEYLSFNYQAEEKNTVGIYDLGQVISPYPFILSLPQDDHENILINHLTHLGISIERNCRLESLQHYPDHVRAVIVSKNCTEIGEYAYLCGCDGARSTTRQQLGLQFLGATTSKLFFVADVEVAEALKPGLNIGMNQVDFCLSFPVRSSQTIRLIGVVPESALKKPLIQFSDVRHAVNSSLKLTIKNVNWFSTYHVHHRVVEHFAQERVFLAGDSAHIHSPVGGQGMNTGIGDAINLGWKLAGVLQKKYPSHLLQSYESERMPFAKRLVSTTDAVFQLINSPSIWGATLRRWVYPYLIPQLFKFTFSKHLFFRLVSQINIRYPNSTFSFKAQKNRLNAGDRLPWITTNHLDNYKLFETLAWQVQVYGQASIVLKTLLKHYSIPCFELEWSDAAKKLGFIKHAVYLIRPDNYLSLIETRQDLRDIKKFLVDIMDYTKI